MHEGPTTVIIQPYLDALHGDTHAEPIIRELLERAVGRLRLLCATLLYKSYPRLARPPVNLEADELLGGVAHEELVGERQKVSRHRVDGDQAAQAGTHADHRGGRVDAPAHDVADDHRERPRRRRHGVVPVAPDVLELVACGATHVALGTVLFGDPDAPDRVRSELAEALERTGFGRVDDAFGAALDPVYMA